MEEKEIALQLVKKDILGEQSQELLELTEESDIITLLSKEIRYLLDKDFKRLCDIMYRLDISEEKFKNILTFSEADKISRDLAVLI